MDHSPATVNKVNKLTKSETEHSSGFLKPTFTSTEHSLFFRKGQRQ